MNLSLLGSTVIKNLPGLPGPCEMSNGLVVKGVKYIREQYLLLGNGAAAAQVLGGIKTANADFFLLVELMVPLQVQPSYRTLWKRAKENEPACALVHPKDLNKNIRVMYYRLEDSDRVWLLC